ncbi:MAG: ATP-binding cassette domain-containing protein [Eubacteriaceae bacterium]|jgi:oligopeptide/dipeptide ABC transporter ATP-binding protein|nr:ATP-binding cassette domain-containing protein [Eubacteriaceae bacterium]
MSEALIKVEEITKIYGKKRFYEPEPNGTRAVADVSLKIMPGEVVGLVGESACGKSTLGRLFLRLQEPTRGKVVFEGQDITKLPASRLALMRKNFQMIFQDPFASLNPRMSVRKTIERTMRIHGMESGRAAIADILDKCGLNPVYMDRFPHEFSGGQRQRIAIARAISVRPKFVVCDEPVSALDVSVQAQVINLLKDLQRQDSLSYLFISHDLSIVRHISDRIVVMYLGKIVEMASKANFFDHPLHPYSAALLSAVPVANPALQKSREKIKLTGELQRSSTGEDRCPFLDRCPSPEGVCAQRAPSLNKANASGSFVSCWKPLQKGAI